MRVILIVGVLGFCLQAHSTENLVKVGVALRFVPEENSFAGSLFQGIEYAKLVFEKEHPELKIELLKYPHKNGHVSVEEAAKKIKNDKVMYVIGGEMSDEAFTLAETFQSQPILLMTPTASNPLLTSGHPLVFRGCFSDDQVATQIEKYVETLSQFHSIGVIDHTSNAYSDFVTNAFLDALSEHAQKNKIAITEFRYANDHPDFKGAVDQFKKAHVDLVVAFILQDELKLFYQDATAAHLKPTYVGSDGWGTTDSLQKWIGEDFIGIRNSYWLENSHDQNVISFKKGFSAKIGKNPDAWNAVAYDAAMTLFEAIGLTKNRSSPNDVAETLHSTTFKKGVTAHDLKFNRKNSISKPFYLYEIKKNEVKFVKEMKS